MNNGRRRLSAFDSKLLPTPVFDPHTSITECRRFCIASSARIARGSETRTEQQQMRFQFSQ